MSKGPLPQVLPLRQQGRNQRKSALPNLMKRGSNAKISEYRRTWSALDWPLLMVSPCNRFGSGPVSSGASVAFLLPSAVDEEPTNGDKDGLVSVCSSKGYARSRVNKNAFQRGLTTHGGGGFMMDRMTWIDTQNNWTVLYPR